MITSQNLEKVDERIVLLKGYKRIVNALIWIQSFFIVLIVCNGQVIAHWPITKLNLTIFEISNEVLC